MHKTLLLAVVAALPVLAQGETPEPRDFAEQSRHWGAAGEMPNRPNRADFHKKMLEKYDADKDGQLSDAEKEAMKADRPHRGRGHGKGRGPKGPRGPQRGEAPQGADVPVTLPL